MLHSWFSSFRDYECNKASVNKRITLK
ncbi:hypothetical protein Gotur_029633 [Gossypium turneri]